MKDKEHIIDNRNFSYLLRMTRGLQKGRRKGFLKRSINAGMYEASALMVDFVNPTERQVAWMIVAKSVALKLFGDDFKVGPNFDAEIKHLMTGIDDDVLWAVNDIERELNSYKNK